MSTVASDPSVLSQAPPVRWKSSRSPLSPPTFPGSRIPKLGRASGPKVTASPRNAIPTVATGGQRTRTDHIHFPRTVGLSPVSGLCPLRRQMQEQGTEWFVSETAAPPAHRLHWRGAPVGPPAWPGWVKPLGGLAGTASPFQMAVLFLAAVTSRLSVPLCLLNSQFSKLSEVFGEELGPHLLAAPCSQRRDFCKTGESQACKAGKVGDLWGKLGGSTWKNRTFSGEFAGALLQFAKVKKKYSE